jgi:hypothetical protein
MSCWEPGQGYQFIKTAWPMEYLQTNLLTKGKLVHQYYEYSVEKIKDFQDIYDYSIELLDSP